MNIKGLFFLADRGDSAKLIQTLKCSFDCIAPPTWAELTRSKPSFVRIRVAELTLSAQKTWPESNETR